MFPIHTQGEEKKNSFEADYSPFYISYCSVDRRVHIDLRPTNFDFIYFFDISGVLFALLGWGRDIADGGFCVRGRDKERGLWKSTMNKYFYELGVLYYISSHHLIFPSVAFLSSFLPIYLPAP